MKDCFKSIKKTTSSRLIILAALFLITFDNLAFFSNILKVYPFTQNNILFLASLAVVFSGFIVLLLSLVCYRYTLKPIVIAVLLISSFASYFMDSYNTIIDTSMIQNVIQTDFAESSDLLSSKLILYVVFLGVLPSYFVYKANIIFEPAGKAIISRVKLFSLTLLGIVAVMLIFGNFYASFIREHKRLRFYANPSYYIHSTIKYINGLITWNARPFELIGIDARIPLNDTHRELIIFVVGETAREDRFSVNGYVRETNPLLKNENIVSFTNFWSCGTTTGVSVPCMFSVYKGSEYDSEKAQSTDNVLDILQRAGVNVLWLDNNSDSKGVALRVPYKSYKGPDINPICDIECRDEGMLLNLQAYIDKHRKGDIFIVLHQLGNHGPAYYKRYPLSFEKFTPVCKTNQLEDCNKEELDNAYDNAILYTDYFLSNVIGLLKQNNKDFETAMFYVSDHGESLGENGLYLHGLPNFIAPDTQRHVPTIIWLGSNFDEIDTKSLAMKRDNRYTHDNIFHTVLGFMEIETSIYDRKLDIIHGK